MHSSLLKCRISGLTLDFSNKICILQKSLGWFVCTFKSEGPGLKCHTCQADILNSSPMPHYTSLLSKHFKALEWKCESSSKSEYSSDIGFLQCQTKMREDMNKSTGSYSWLSLGSPRECCKNLDAQDLHHRIKYWASVPQVTLTYS